MPLVTPLISLNLLDLDKAIGHQVFPTQPMLREVEDFLGGDNYPKHVPLLTYLASWNQKVLVGNFYLCVRLYYKTLYHLLTAFEPTL